MSPGLSAFQERSFLLAEMRAGHEAERGVDASGKALDCLAVGGCRRQTKRVWCSVHFNAEDGSETLTAIRDRIERLRAAKDFATVLARVTLEERERVAREVAKEEFGIEVETDAAPLRSHRCHGYANCCECLSCEPDMDWDMRLAA
jgi:hypothetical protein